MIRNIINKLYFLLKKKLLFLFLPYSSCSDRNVSIGKGILEGALERWREEWCTNRMSNQTFFKAKMKQQQKTSYNIYNKINQWQDNP
jgi:hypothetical protein